MGHLGTLKVSNGLDSTPKPATQCNSKKQTSPSIPYSQTEPKTPTHQNSSKACFLHPPHDRFRLHKRVESSRDRGPWHDIAPFSKTFSHK